jgi:hypothetical protein
MDNVNGEMENDLVCNELIYRYYEDQWLHVRHHDQQRSTITLQLLILGTTLAGAYFASEKMLPEFSKQIRIISSATISVLAVLGLLLSIKTTKAIQTHIIRARKARESLGFLEQFAKSENAEFPRLHVYYTGFFLVMLASGIALFCIGIMML